jgi:signal transduction histidine kinase
MPAPDPVADSIFAGGEIAAATARAVDWSQTALGPPTTWPHALRTAVRTMLHTRQATSVFWGSEYVNIYNDGFVPLLGGKHPAAMGQSAREVWSDAWPVVGELLERVLTRGEAVLFEEALVPIVRGGRLEDAWWNYSYSPLFDDEGQLAGILVVATETTAAVRARKQLEEAKVEAELARAELHGIFMHAPFPIALLRGAEHRFVLVNGPYRALVGREVDGRSLREAFSQEEVGQYLPHLDRVFATGEPLILQEASLRLPDASGVVRDRFIDVGYYAWRDSAGAPAGVLAVIHDVTDKVDARLRESRLRTAAEEANRAKDEFLAIISHELRNPLAPIVTALRVMELRGLQGGERERAVIGRQVEHLTRVVDDLLDVSRIANGKVPLATKVVEVADVVAGAIEVASPMLEERKHRLRVDVPRPGLPVRVDVERMTQVLSNLLTNACKYTDAGGEIRIEAGTEGADAVLRVRDTGIGIEEGMLARVFDLFTQERQSVDRSRGGLGLGLAIVRNLVRMHGGRVMAESEGRGKGATFTVRLPLSETMPDAAQQAATQPFTATSRPDARRVLIVDDNRDSAEMLAEMLGVIGHVTEIADDGPCALVVAERFTPQVVLLDIGLPAMDGYEVARRLRAASSTARARLFAVTGYGQEADQARSQDAGFDGHLVKPVDLEAVVRAVEGA